MAFTTVILKGTIKNPITGLPAEGRVEVIPSAPLIKDETGNEVYAGSGVVYLDAQGQFSIEVPASDDGTLVPTGFGYTIKIRVPGAKIDPFDTYLNAADAEVINGDNVIDLADITPTTIVPIVENGETVSGAQAKANAAEAAAKAYTDQEIAQVQLDAVTASDLNALLVAGTGISLTLDAQANTLTVTATGTATHNSYVRVAFGQEGEVVQDLFGVPERHNFDLHLHPGPWDLDLSQETTSGDVQAQLYYIADGDTVEVPILESPITIPSGQKHGTFTFAGTPPTIPARARIYARCTQVTPGTTVGGGVPTFVAAGPAASSGSTSGVAPGGFLTPTLPGNLDDHVGKLAVVLVGSLSNIVPSIPAADTDAWTALPGMPMVDTAQSLKLTAAMRVIQEGDQGVQVTFSGSGASPAIAQIFVFDGVDPSDLFDTAFDIAHVEDAFANTTTTGSSDTTGTNQLVLMLAVARTSADDAVGITSAGATEAASSEFTSRTGSPNVGIHVATVDAATVGTYGAIDYNAPVGEGYRWLVKGISLLPALVATTPGSDLTLTGTGWYEQ